MLNRPTPFIFILALAALLGAARTPVRPAATIDQVSLGWLPPNTSGAEVVVSPDNQRAAFIRPKDWKVVPVIDGREGAEYDWIVGGRIDFSADSRHFAFAARDRRGQFMVLDGVRQPPRADRANPPVFDAISSWTLSPAGQLLYAARRANQYFAFWADRESGPYLHARIVSAPHASAPALFVARTDRGETLIADGKPGPFYTQVADVIASSDNRHVACRALRDGKWIILHDAAEGRPYDQVSAPRLSPTGQRIAYAALRDNRAYFVIDAAESRPYDAAGDRVAPLFSPDARRTFYVGSRAGNSIAVVDNQESAQFPWIGPHAAFSADSRHLAYVARLESGRSSIILDNAPLRECDAVYEMRFSPAGNRLAWSAAVGNQACVFLDTQRSPAFEEIERGSISFSPDGQHMAFVGRRAGKSILVLDGAELATFDHILATHGLSIADNGALHAIAIRNHTTRANDKPLEQRELLRLTLRPTP